MGASPTSTPFCSQLRLVPGDIPELEGICSAHQTFIECSLCEGIEIKPGVVRILKHHVVLISLSSCGTGTQLVWPKRFAHKITHFLFCVSFFCTAEVWPETSDMVSPGISLTKCMPQSQEEPSEGHVGMHCGTEAAEGAWFVGGESQPRQNFRNSGKYTPYMQKCRILLKLSQSRISSPLLFKFRYDLYIQHGIYTTILWVLNSFFSLLFLMFFFITNLLLYFTKG